MRFFFTIFEVGPFLDRVRNHMLKSLLFIFTFCISLSAISGDRFDAIYGKAMSNLTSNPKLTIQGLLEAEQNAFDESNKADLAQCYWGMGYTYQVVNNYSNAKKYYLGALRVYESLGNIEGQIMMLENVGTLSLDNGLAKSAYVSYKKRFDIAVKSKNNEWISEAHIDLGLALRGMDLFDSARVHFNSALVNAKESANHDDVLSRIYNQIGINTKQKSVATDQPLLLDSAEAWFRKSYLTAQKPVNKFHGSNNIGNVLRVKKDYSAAREWLTSAYRIGEVLNSERLLVTIYNNLGLIHFDEKKYQEADSLFNMAVDMNMSDGDVKSIITDHRLMLSFDNVKEGTLSLRYLDSINQILPFSQLKSAALARINSESFERQIMASQQRASAIGEELEMVKDDFIPDNIQSSGTFQLYIISVLSLAGLIMALTIFVLVRRNTRVSNA